MFENLKDRKPSWIDMDLYKKYAIAVPFIKESQSLLFEIRSQELQSQPGDICFPGGSIDFGESPEHAAKRELSEELLLPMSKIRTITELDTMINPSYSIIYSFLVELSSYKGNFSKHEVENVFTVPFEYFLKNKPEVYYNQVVVSPFEDGGQVFPYNKIVGGKDYPWRASKYPLLFYNFEDKAIWGLTAKIVENLVSLYLSV